MEEECAVCYVTDELQNAHLFPKRHGGKVTIPLCRKHHSAFDWGNLNEQEKGELFYNVVFKLEKLAEVIKQLKRTINGANK